MTRLAALVALTLAGLLGGCALAPPPPVGLLEVAERPAEKALLSGIRAYEDGQYPVAEALLNQALRVGLASPRDRAGAHKHLAFIFCTTERIANCESEFRAARKDDPAFTLSKAESGHPLWGPVFQRLSRP
jgi:Tfp pilus assembly protein PilF